MGVQHRRGTRYFRRGVVGVLQPLVESDLVRIVSSSAVLRGVSGVSGVQANRDWGSRIPRPGCRGYQGYQLPIAPPSPVDQHAPGSPRSVSAWIGYSFTPRRSMR